MKGGGRQYYFSLSSDRVTVFTIVPNLDLRRGGVCLFIEMLLVYRCEPESERRGGAVGCG